MNQISCDEMIAQQEAWEAEVFSLEDMKKYVKDETGYEIKEI